jgi:uncharacterized protein (DUF427 family)
VNPVIPESAADRDYPQMAAERGRVEPAPRRVRGYVDGVLVFDTVAARYVWEVPYYPQYYVPLKDVRTPYLVDEDHAQRLQFGTSRSHALDVNGVTIAEAVRVFDGDDALSGIADTARFAWDAVDWFEEDERIVGGHPRSPYARVDALRSHRHVRVERDGVLLADTRAPVLLFETGLPTRYYIDRTDVAFEHLIASDTQTACPYKGVTSGYWSARIGDAVVPDVAWTYQYPDRSVATIASMLAFYNEQVDIVVDGTPLSRPRTHFVR